MGFEEGIWDLWKVGFVGCRWDLWDVGGICGM